MATVSKTCDIFISHAEADSGLAQEIASACRASGLETVTDADFLGAAGDIGHTLREALAESRALVAIFSATAPTSPMTIEIGAAQAWNKPIYAIIADPSAARVPGDFSGIPLFTAGRIRDVIKAVKSNIRQLSDDDRVFLAEIYAAMGVSLDELEGDPGPLDILVEKFEKGRGKAVAGERLLSELSRLRKQGKLTKKRSAHQSTKTKSEPAH
jgi:hypothetical protein